MSTPRTRSQPESSIGLEEKEPDNVSEEYHDDVNLEGRSRCYDVMNVAKNVTKSTRYKCYEVYQECYKVYLECCKVCKEAQCELRSTHCYNIITEAKETKKGTSTHLQASASTATKQSTTCKPI